jgi:serine/threonine protein kinase
MPARPATRRSAVKPRPLNKSPGAEPIPGYRLVSRLGRGGFGEVWKCLAPGGLLKAVKFVHGNLHSLDAGAATAEEELRAIERVKAIRHPFLLSMERVESIRGELVIVLELADRNLYDALMEHVVAGKPGIPRQQVLGYLAEAAEALDVMSSQHHLQHLDIKPQNLFLLSNHVKVGDFGLVNSLPAHDGLAHRACHLDAVSPLYAAPELLQGQVSRSCDQYSLAIVYHELLTGKLPFDGKNPRQLLLQHVHYDPDLDALPPADRVIVARALAKDPGERFATCADFVVGLLESRGTKSPSPVSEAAPIPTATDHVPGSTPDDPAFLSDGRSLHAQLSSCLPPGVIQLRLDGFRRQWGGQVIHRDEETFILEVKTPRSFWQRWMRRRPGLEVHVRLSGSPAMESASDITVDVRTRDLGRGQGAEAIQIIGLLLLQSLRGNLQTPPRRRAQERLVWRHPLQVCPLRDGETGEPIECRGHDLSLSGIGFQAPVELPIGPVNLCLPQTPQTPALAMSARIMRVRRRDDGCWDVGATLIAPS